MTFRTCHRLGLLTIVTGFVNLLGLGALHAQEKSDRTANLQAALRQLPPDLRDKVKNTLDRATFQAQGPTEEFTCHPTQYYWLLDHPDRALQAWKRLGVQGADIQDLGNGRFGSSDGHGNEVHWDTVYRSPTMRIWYAEGKVHPGALLPTSPVQAVIIFRHQEGQDEAGRPVLRHQADLYAHADGKAIQAVTKLMGNSTSKLAEQFLTSLERFFSALSVYLHKHPSQVQPLLAERVGK